MQLLLLIKQEWCLVVLDIHPSNKARMEMLRIMHNTRHVSILVLTPLLGKDENMTLFRAGADVCLDKATDMEICVAQASALLQIYLKSCAEQEIKDVITFGTELIINPKCRQVLVDGEPLELTRKKLLSANKTLFRMFGALDIALFPHRLRLKQYIP